jgi:hypothetical protein
MSRARIGTGAVLVCLAVSVSCSDDNDAAPATTTSPPTEPATTPAPDPVTAAAEIAQGFADAWGANDVDRALTYLTDFSAVKVPRNSLTATSFESLDDLRRWSAAGDAVAMAADWIVEDCERHNITDAGINFHCGYAFHAFGSHAIGLGPYGGNHLDITVRDGKIVEAMEVVNPNTNELGSEMWFPFADWLVANHPDDVLVMFATADGQWLKDSYTDDEIRVWAQRVEEYVQVVLTRRQAYPSEVGAICATQAAQLGELAVPAEGAPDQVAAWNRAAGAIIDHAHGDLIALDKPPSTDIHVYTNFYGRLARLVRIAEESAQAATAGDSTRLTELDAEYHEIRRAINSAPSGSGLQECAASLPT